MPAPLRVKKRLRPTIIVEVNSRGKPIMYATVLTKVKMCHIGIYHPRYRYDWLNRVPRAFWLVKSPVYKNFATPDSMANTTADLWAWLEENMERTYAKYRTELSS